MMAEEVKAQLKSLLEWKANIEQQQPQPSVTVVTTSDRKLRYFSGASGESAEEWLEDAKCVSRNMPQREAAEFLMRHLEGPARTEMRHRPREDQEDATLLLADILETFGERLTATQLTKKVYECQQGQRESLREFSYRIQSLVGRLQDKEEVEVDVMTKAVFVENVYEPTLRRELKRYTRETPDATFLMLRNHAMDWVEEGLPRGRNLSSRCDAVVGVESSKVDVESSVLANRLEEVEKGQLALASQMTALAKQVEKLSLLQDVSNNNTTRARMTSTRPPERDRDGRIVCYRCHHPGHIARDCHNSESGNE